MEDSVPCRLLARAIEALVAINGRFLQPARGCPGCLKEQDRCSRTDPDVAPSVGETQGAYPSSAGCAWRMAG